MIPSKEPILLPPLPQVSGDPSILFDVFTHRSISGGSNNNEYGNSDRLAHIGDAVFRQAVVDHWFFKRPVLSVEEMKAKEYEATSDTKVMYWVNMYDFKRKISFGSRGSTILNVPSESRWFFNAYVGALYIRGGLEVVKKWASGLIDPDSHGSADGVRPSGYDQAASRPTSPGSSTAVSQSQPPTYYSQTASRSSSPGSSYTQKPPTPPQSPPGHSRVPVTVSHFHQTATQKKVNVSYIDSSEGPSHLPVWTVTCYVNTVAVGRGTKTNKKEAKEDAVQQAWTMLGW